MAAKWLLATLLLLSLLARTCVAVAPVIPFFCRLNELQCPSKINQCIQSLDLCNGIKNCADGSDEKAAFCKAYACNDSHPVSVVNLARGPYPPVEYNRKCPSGNMCTKTSVAGVQKYPYGEAWLCTGEKKDCADGSDEDPRYCKRLAQNCTLNAQGEFDYILAMEADTCPSKKYCVAKYRLCDGKKDCVDGSDEWPSFCKNFACANEGYVTFRCKDWGCLSNDDQICDGVKNCGDGSDEDPAFCKKYSCPRSNGRKCSNGRICLSDSQLCDGVRTCPDGSDERSSFCRTFQCPGLKYKCKDGKQCAGYVDFDARCFRGASTIGEFPFCKDNSDANNAFCPPSPAPAPVPPNNGTCGDPENEVRCPTGVGCISKEALCNGIKDCADGSDEGKFCKKYDCRFSTAFGGSVLCKDTLQCTLGAACNGWLDCGDKSDEDPAFCKTFKCPEGSQKCKNFPYQCIANTFLCDGTKQCINGGDEDQAFCKAFRCPAGQRKCPNYPYQCIDETSLCDGTKQCINGGDEDPTFCKSFKCMNGMQKCPNYPYLCISPSSLCDGEKICPNGGDEDPAFCKTFKCSEGQIKCPKSPTYQCTYEGALCDGYKSCSDGSDENPAFCKTYTCPADYLKCPNSPTYQCVPATSLCDGYSDCKDGSDENPAFCKTYTCPADQRKCPTSPTCIYDSSLCDGFRNCVDGSDEDPILCANFTQPVTFAVAPTPVVRF